MKSKFIQGRLAQRRVPLFRIGVYNTFKRQDFRTFCGLSLKTKELVHCPEVYKILQRFLRPRLALQRLQPALKKFARFSKTSYCDQKSRTPFWNSDTPLVRFVCLNLLVCKAQEPYTLPNVCDSQASGFSYLCMILSMDFI